MTSLKKHLTIFVSTCDSYSDLWIPFSKCLEKYVDLGCEVIFVSESKKFDKYQTITPGFLPWGERNLIALNEVKTYYIFWLFEDYFFTKPLKKSVIINYLDFVINNDLDRLQISPNWQNTDTYSFLNKHQQSPKFDYKMIASTDPYSVSMQPSIWKKDYIKKLLHKNYSPWDFEIKGSLINSSKKVCIDSSVNKYPYFNAVRKKRILNLTVLINKVDRLIEKLFYDNKPYKYSKGLKKLIEHEKLNL